MSRLGIPLYVYPDGALERYEDEARGQAQPIRGLTIRRSVRRSDGLGWAGPNRGFHKLTRRECVWMWSPYRGPGGFPVLKIAKMAECANHSSLPRSCMLMLDWAKLCGSQCQSWN